MYRFSIGNEDWIIIFSPHLSLEKGENEAAMHSIALMGQQLSGFTHGESFVIFHEKIGALTVRAERIPSLILTVTAAVPRNRWYIKDGNNIEPFEA